VRKPALQPWPEGQDVTHIWTARIRSFTGELKLEQHAVKKTTTLFVWFPSGVEDLGFATRVNKTDLGYRYFLTKDDAVQTLKWELCQKAHRNLCDAETLRQQLALIHHDLPNTRRGIDIALRDFVGYEW